MPCLSFGVAHTPSHVKSVSSVHNPLLSFWVCLFLLLCAKGGYPSMCRSPKGKSLNRDLPSISMSESASSMVVSVMIVQRTHAMVLLACAMVLLVCACVFWFGRIGRSTVVLYQWSRRLVGSTFGAQIRSFSRLWFLQMTSPPGRWTIGRFSDLGDGSKKRNLLVFWYRTSNPQNNGTNWSY